MEIIKNFLYPNKNDILDPLSLVIKLYIYSYKPIGTKISILNNKIDIQENGIFQSTVRTFKGDTKNDLINILFPLTFACEMYLNEKNQSQYHTLFIQVLKSLDKLDEMYQINEIAHNIEQLKNIIRKFITTPDFNPRTIVSNWDEPASALKKSFYKQTNSVWTSHRLNVLFGYVYEITNSQSDEMTNKLVESLCSFMDYIDLLVIKLIAELHLLR
jgi:hypothetical protein